MGLVGWIVIIGNRSSKTPSVPITQNCVWQLGHYLLKKWEREYFMDTQKSTTLAIPLKMLKCNFSTNIFWDFESSQTKYWEKDGLMRKRMIFQPNGRGVRGWGYIYGGPCRGVGGGWWGLWGLCGWWLVKTKFTADMRDHQSAADICIHYWARATFQMF